MQKIAFLFVFIFALTFSAQAQTTWREWDSLGMAYQAQQQYKMADSAFNQSLNIIEQEYGKIDTLYTNTLSQLLASAYYQGDYKRAIAYGEQQIDIEEQLFGKMHRKYVATCTNLGILYQSIGIYDKAELFLTEGKNSATQVFGKMHPTYGSACNNLASLYQVQGFYAKAEVLFLEFKQIQEQISGKMDKSYANACNNLANLYEQQGLYHKAADLYIEAKGIYEQVVGKTHTDYARACNNLAALYQEQGFHEKAEPLYIEAKNIYEQVFGKMHPEYATSCNNLAHLYQIQGWYTEAENFYIEAKNIQAQILGDKHPAYANTCSNLANLYFSQGLYKKAHLIYTEAKNIAEQAFGKIHPETAKYINNLAGLYKAQGLYDKAEPLYIEAQNIYAQFVGKNHPYYAVSCSNLADLCMKKGLYTKAEPLMVESVSIIEQSLGKNHPYYTKTIANLAGLYYSQDAYDKAEPLYIEAKNTQEKLFGKRHPDYTAYCNSLAGLYHKKGAYQQAAPLYAEALNNTFADINTYLPAFSEKERIAYLSSLAIDFANFQDFALHYQKENPKITADLYNQNLFTKSLVFASTQKMRQQILSSGDSSLIQDFENWKTKKDTYNKLLQKSKEEQEKSGVSLTQMASDINELEKSLSKRSTLFTENTTIQNYKWQQVKDKLGKKEAVVEIMRTYKTKGYDSLGRGLADTVYVALIVTNKTKKQPEMLVLENGSELETKYLNYYKRAIEFKIEDQNSYNQYWKPIDEKLKSLNKRGFDKIYFSPDGVYHQISLNSLQNLETGEFLLASQNIQLIGTSRDLIELGNNETDLSQNFENYRAYLLGYPTYNFEGEGKNVEGEDRSFSSLQRIVGQRGAVALLPGTKTEIETIKGYFNQKNIKTQVLLEADANEENFKSFKSPTILHVATHGFFVPKIKDSEVQTMQDAVNRQLLENPFMRSGLLLAGCETPNPEGEDGVLTAEEAMNLSLENTELVVLSACETGLGDIQNGEGVFGLQRAFQQAGAKTILMSLWKVSDEATQLLMTEFYRNLLSGKSKREAFKAAQLALKQKYPEPYYWGAFVMIGE
ncbi:MAG: CHAT domain-containing protein [Bernardetiaceae bacterium]|nr:CHAT domain-containing protein [Bernardetiaceae bacterium]